MLSMLAKSLGLLASVQAVAGRVLPATEQSLARRAADGPLNSVYFVNWGIYDRDYQPADLPGDEITHVLYSFMNVKPDGTVFSEDDYADIEKLYPDDTDDGGNNAFGCVKQLYKLKKEHRQMKTMLSIGGWTWSENFPAAAATEEGRSTFAKTSVEFLSDWGLDGIDIDWEYPASTEEGENMILLLQAVRDELDAYAKEHADGHHFDLSIAAPAGPNHIEHLKIKELGEVLDHINLMAYDFAGSFSDAAGHQANIYPSEDNPESTPFSTQVAVDLYLDGGVPPEKLILGMPIYGRAFVETEGPGEAFSGVGDGSWEDGIWDYKELPMNNATVEYDETIGATWTYDAASKTMISFDTPDMIKEKVSYAQDLGLGGSMFWEASADKAGDESLITTAKNSMGGIDSTENFLSYPNSKYDNIKNNLE